MFILEIVEKVMEPLLWSAILVTLYFLRSPIFYLFKRTFLNWQNLYNTWSCCSPM